MTEHVVLKTVKRDLRFVENSSVKAGMSRLLVDAGNLKWLVEQTEKAERYEKALSYLSDCTNYMDIDFVLDRVEEVAKRALENRVLEELYELED